MPTDRLREHPAQRLAPPVAAIDLRAAAAELRAEAADAAQHTHGHRQKVLARHGDATVALFLFDADASLPPHQTRGTVSIQTVEGELHVAADGREHRLAPGELIVLGPGVQHAVRATAPSVMLLTVALQA